jgi:hypothetical protein
VRLYAQKGGAALDAVGHTFVELVPDGGAGKFHGFYPTEFGPNMYFKQVNASLEADSGHAWTRRITWLVKTADYNKSAKFVKDAQAALRKYFLLDKALGGAENCTSWAVGVVNAAALVSPNAKNLLGIYDPKALNAALAAIGENLFNDCGKMEVALGGLSGGESSEDPIDFSPEGALQMALEAPEILAANLGIELVDATTEPVEIANGGAITIVVSGAFVGEFAAIIDWGDGTLELLTEAAQATHVAPVGGEVRVAIFEDGSIQRTIIPVTMGAPAAQTVVIAVEDFPEVVLPNGPFDGFDPPELIDITSCATDCDEDGVPDCEQGDPRVGGDCDGNGQLDSCDIAEGLLTDGDGDGVPDSCETCMGDLNGDGAVSGADLGLLLSAWGAASSADLDGSGTVDGADLGLMLSSWGLCP